MVRAFRFAVVSDPHITLPHTLRHAPQRLHLVELSLPALEQILQRLEQETIDFLLLPGDLTQHGERENHHWLVNRLQALPFPAYVVPGNHDVLVRDGCDRTLSLSEFPQLYQACGYTDERPYYHQEVLPGVHLLGLNSIGFDAAGNQHYSGYVDEAQLAWLDQQLAALSHAWVMVMIHHNVLEHLPGQAQHPLGQRYIVQNRQALISRLQAAGVRLILTGHLHVQDTAQQDALWEITTGSLVSYPHPYRLVTVTPAALAWQLQVESHHVQPLPNWPDLQAQSRQWMRERALPFMTKLLTLSPFDLPLPEAERLAPCLREFWADISAGDTHFDFPQLPAAINQHLKSFGAIDTAGNHHPIDNAVTLWL